MGDEEKKQKEVLEASGSIFPASDPVLPASEPIIPEAGQIEPQKFTEEEKKDILIQILDHGTALSPVLEIFKDYRIIFQTLTVEQIQEIQAIISETVKTGKNYDYILNEASLLNLACGIYALKGKKIEGSLEDKKKVIIKFSDILLNVIRKKFLSFIKGVENLVKESDTNFSMPR